MNKVKTVIAIVSLFAGFVLVMLHLGFFGTVLGLLLLGFGAVLLIISQGIQKGKKGKKGKNEEDKKGGITVNVFDPEAINKRLGNIMGKNWLENKK